MTDAPDALRPQDDAMPTPPYAGTEESTPPRKPTPTPTTGSDYSPSGPGMAEIEREVAEAMEAMDAEDRGALGGQVVDDPETIPVGTELVGTVTGVTSEDVFLQFGVKTQGVLPRAHFGKKEPIETGRRVDVVAERFDAESGLLLVSRKGAAQRATWTNLSIGMLVEGRVTGVIKGGLELDLKGIRAFMPGSQVDIIPMKDVSTMLNESLRCEVIELDRRAKNVIVSRRKVQEREQKEAREKLLTELAEGQVRRGIVRRITDFGAFVDLGGVDGLLHIRELSWGTVEKVSDVVSVDQEVDVMVLKIDTKRDRISLGLRQALPDPWANVPERYTNGSTLKARIVRIADFGAFAEVEPGVEGLIPVSEMSWSRIRTPADAVSVGDMVDCAVIRVEPDKRRMALSMRQSQADPWAEVLNSFTPQSTAKGKVTRLADFGAFVELVPGVEGLIHISELSDRRVNTCADVVQVGQEVETRILGVDQENRRISLSIKALHAPAEPVAAAAHATAEDPAKPKKRKKALRGGLSSHFEW